jgi:heme O synthase-like polyprenyltransferase
METIMNFIKEWYFVSVICGGISVAITMFAGWALVKSLSMVTDSDEETEDEE